MPKYNIGDKVQIVSNRASHFNPNGKMDKYLNTIMTIKSIDQFIQPTYRMIEDNGDWCWWENMIVRKIDSFSDLLKGGTRLVEN